MTALKERLQHAHDGRTQPRLQMLSRLASGPARTRQDVARLLGVQRHTMSQGLAVAAVGGRAALRATYVPRGTPAPFGYAAKPNAASAS